MSKLTSFDNIFFHITFFVINVDGWWSEALRSFSRTRPQAIHRDLQVRRLELPKKLFLPLFKKNLVSNKITHLVVK